jgi:hypothetical protein
LGWCHTTHTTQGGIQTGTLYVEVLNSLRNPSTAADEIEFIVETSADSDFQFAIPYATTGQKVYHFPPPTPNTGIAQSADDTVEECIPFFEAKGMSGIGVNTLTTGEIVTSLRQLLKRYEYMLPGAEYPSYYAFNPYLSAPHNGFDADISPQTSYLRITQLFRFFSGSMRLMFLPAEGFTQDDAGATRVNLTTINQTAFPFTPHTKPDPDSEAFVGRANILFSNTLEKFKEVSLPYYRDTPIALTDIGQPSLKDGFHGIDGMYHQNAYGLDYAGPAGVDVMRSIGEDFSFGYLIGPPQTWSGTTPP